MVLTLESTNIILIVSPPYAEFCYYNQIIFTLVFHIDLKGLIVKLDKKHPSISREMVFSNGVELNVVFI